MSINGFGNYAVKLAKTPLGLIALFVLLVEVTASMVVGTSSNLSDLNQTILVIFISIFPFVVVVMFWHLVVKHNVKLYSPSEFPNHDDFLAANKVNPTHLLEEFKKDLIAEIEQRSGDNDTRATRSHIEKQAVEYLEAVEFLREHRLSETEVQALVALNRDQLGNEQAEERYGETVVKKLKDLDLITKSSARFVELLLRIV